MILRDENNKVSIVVVIITGMVRDFSRIAWALFPVKAMFIARSFLLTFDNSVRFARENFPEVKIVALSGGAL